MGDVKTELKQLIPNAYLQLRRQLASELKRYIMYILIVA